MIEAQEIAGVTKLTTPTLSPGETHAYLLSDRSSFADYDTEVAGARGSGLVRLHQLALEHLLDDR